MKWNKIFFSLNLIWQSEFNPEVTENTFEDTINFSVRTTPVVNILLRPLDADSFIYESLSKTSFSSPAFSCFTLQLPEAPLALPVCE